MHLTQGKTSDTLYSSALGGGSSFSWATSFNLSRTFFGKSHFIASSVVISDAGFPFRLGFLEVVMAAPKYDYVFQMKSGEITLDQAQHFVVLKIASMKNETIALPMTGEALVLIGEKIREILEDHPEVAEWGGRKVN